MDDEPKSSLERSLDLAFNQVDNLKLVIRDNGREIQELKSNYSNARSQIHHHEERIGSIAKLLGLEGPRHAVDELKKLLKKVERLEKKAKGKKT